VKERNYSTLDADILDHFSHVHFAFADLSTDVMPSAARFQDQFDKFTKRKDWKRMHIILET